MMARRVTHRRLRQTRSQLRLAEPQQPAQPGVDADRVSVALDGCLNECGDTLTLRQRAIILDATEGDDRGWRRALQLTVTPGVSLGLAVLRAGADRIVETPPPARILAALEWAADLNSSTRKERFSA